MKFCNPETLEKQESKWPNKLSYFLCKGQWNDTLPSKMIFPEHQICHVFRGRRGRGVGNGANYLSYVWKSCSESTNTKSAVLHQKKALVAYLRLWLSSFLWSLSFQSVLNWTWFAWNFYISWTNPISQIFGDLCQSVGKGEGCFLFWILDLNCCRNSLTRREWAGGGIRGKLM